MDQNDAPSLLAYLRSFGSEDPTIEAKRATGALPISVRESMSAFANTPGGGLLILGVDQATGFAATGVDDVARMQHDLASAARDDVFPPLSPVISMHHVEGVQVIVADFAELPRVQKPCYVKSRGVHGGSYIRVADGDRRLTSEEVAQLIADRGQPRFDHELVEGATLGDLDPIEVSKLVARMKSANPRLFGAADEPTVLKMMNVARMGDVGMQPTLAGLLALGTYPQEFFPQLCLTFVHYPTVRRDAAQGVRFLDNVRIDGSIPVMASEALAVVQRNMSRRSFVDGGGRRDVWEYPPEALREAIVNALVHRDLSPGSRGTQVQVEMYPDRLRVLNAGGLFGAVDISRLGDENVSSSRNAALLKLLEDVTVPGDVRTVCENRGSGIRTMRAEFARAGMSPPDFVDGLTTFRVEMPNHTLLDEGVVSWLGQIGNDGLKDTQRTALAVMRQGQVIDNARYRAVTGLSDSRVATAELQDLVARELVEQSGTRGGARYSLSEYAQSVGNSDSHKRVRPNRRKQVLDLLDLHRDLSKSEVATLLNLNPKTAEHWLGRLKRSGDIVAVGSGPKNTRYQIAPPKPVDPVVGQESLFD